MGTFEVAKYSLHYDMATSLWGPRVECGGLNENGSHRLKGGGTVRRYSLVKVGVALLEEVCH